MKGRCPVGRPINRTPASKLKTVACPYFSACNFCGGLEARGCITCAALRFGSAGVRVQGSSGPTTSRILLKVWSEGLLLQAARPAKYLNLDWVYRSLISKAPPRE